MHLHHFRQLTVGMLITDPVG